MTTEVLQGERIAQAILETRPTHVAVAYLGADWRTYLPDVSRLEAVIVAPVLGTNPWAVQELVRELETPDSSGWERVYFLDNLHAKLYLGSSMAVWGSANLTRNGLAGDRLIELGTASRNADSLATLRQFFDATLLAAKQAYPAPEMRSQRLSDLTAETQRNPGIAISLGKQHAGRATSLRDFKLLSDDQFYVCLYDAQDAFEHTEAGSAIASRIEEECHFAKEDAVIKGKWVLLCQLTANTKISRRTKPRWMLIDDVIEDGVELREGREYPQLAIQRNDVERATNWQSLVPFELTQDAIMALQAAVSEKKVLNYFMQHGDEPLRLRDQIGGVTLLVDRMKVHLSN